MPKAQIHLLVRSDFIYIVIAGIDTKRSSDIASSAIPSEAVTALTKSDIQAECIT